MKEEINKIREALANYMSSEGCDCCSNAEKHAKHEEKTSRTIEC